MLSKPKKKDGLKKNDIIFLISAMVLPLLQFFVFYVVVNANSFLMAFQDTTDGITYTWNGLKTFQKAFEYLFQDPNYALIMKNTFVLYFWSNLVMLFISVFVSYCVWKKVPGWKFFSIILFLPSVISSVTFVMILQKLVNGFLPEIFNNKELVTLLNPLNKGFELTTFYLCFLSFGGTMIMFLGSMSQIDSSLLEYGELDGMNTWHEFFYLVIPHIWPTVISMVIMGLAGMLSNQGLLLSFYGAAPEVEVQTFALRMYAVVLGKNYMEYTAFSAMGVFFTVVVVVLSFTVRHLMEKYGPRED